MKKAIVVALTAGLLAGALVGPADAGKKKKPVPPPPAPVKIERVVEYEYAPNVGVALDVNAGGLCKPDTGNPGKCAGVPLEAGEAFVKISVADKSGKQVFGSLSQGDTDGDGVGNLYGEFCGAHPEPVEMLSQSAPLQISIYNGSRGACKESVAVGGVATITFSNIP